MAQRKTKQKAKPRKQGGARKPPAKPQAPEPNGVVVVLTPAGEGKESIGFQTLGKTTPREIPVLLAQARLAAEKQQGIE